MAVNLSPVGGVAAQFFTNTGAVLTGGKLYTYAAGTTTPAVTYTSSNGATPQPNPIVLDAAGRVSGSGEIWLTDGINYKFVLKDSNDVLIATYDNVSGINSNFIAFTNQQEIVTATAGQTVFNLSISYSPGTNSLSVFVDGVNQYGPGAQYAYVETDSDTVTFVSGLHVGAEVKFTTSQLQGGGSVDAQQVSYVPPFTGSVATNVEAKLAQTVSVMDFGAVGDGATDDTAAIQAAIDAMFAAGGGEVLFPVGTYLVSAMIEMKNSVSLTGTGDTSQILVNTDIVTFGNTPATTSTQLVGVVVTDLYLRNTITGAKTNYDIYFKNPTQCVLRRVHVRSGHTDTQYSNTNVGGVYFQKLTGSTNPAWINTLDDCFIQNNSILFNGISDSSIRGGYVWGHTRAFTIQLIEGGNIDISDINGIIPSQYFGGIYLTGSFTNQIRISNCEFDCNPTLQTGICINAIGLSRIVSVTNVTFWTPQRESIRVEDPIGWSIVGNTFWNGNRDDNYLSSILISGVTLAPENNTITGNSFVIDEARTNPGYAIEEYNGGQAPSVNSYVANAVSGDYQSPAILTIGTPVLAGNNGNQTQNKTSFGESLLIQNDAYVASAGTLDLSVNTATYLANPGGFAGTLSVTATQSNAATFSTRTVYAAVARGTTFTFTPLATQNGSGGGVTFTLTMPSNGVVRYTDTSGAGVDIIVRMHFSGVKSAA